MGTDALVRPRSRRRRHWELEIQQKVCWAAINAPPPPFLFPRAPFMGQGIQNPTSSENGRIRPAEGGVATLLSLTQRTSPSTLFTITSDLQNIYHLYPWRAQPRKHNKESGGGERGLGVAFLDRIGSSKCFGLTFMATFIITPPVRHHSKEMSLHSLEWRHGRKKIFRGKPKGRKLSLLALTRPTQLTAIDSPKSRLTVPSTPHTSPCGSSTVTDMAFIRLPNG